MRPRDVFDLHWVINLSFLAIMRLKQSVSLSSCTMLFARRVLSRSVIWS